MDIFVAPAVRISLPPANRHKPSVLVAVRSNAAESNVRIQQLAGENHRDLRNVQREARSDKS